MSLKKFPPEISLCANCGGFFGRVKKNDLNWDDSFFDKYNAEKSDEYLTVSCVCTGRVCLNCGKYSYAPISNVYYKESNSIEHVPYISGMRACECGKNVFERSVLNVEKHKSLGDWYVESGKLGYSRPVAMCAGIMQAVEKWGLSVAEVFRLFLACKIIIHIGKMFMYDLRGYEAITRLFVHHCFECQIWRVNTTEKEDCLRCGKAISLITYNYRNGYQLRCVSCEKELVIGEGFVIGAFLHGYFRCQKCAIENTPHLKVYFKAAPMVVT